eukprot:s5783_g3.t1
MAYCRPCLTPPRLLPAVEEGYACLLQPPSRATVPYDWCRRGSIGAIVACTARCRLTWRGPSDSLLRCHQQSGEILRQQEDAIEMDEAVQVPCLFYGLKRDADGVERVSVVEVSDGERLMFIDRGPPKVGEPVFTAEAVVSCKSYHFVWRNDHECQSCIRRAVIDMDDGHKIVYEDPGRQTLSFPFFRLRAEGFMEYGHWQFIGYLRAFAQSIFRSSSSSVFLDDYVDIFAVLGLLAGKEAQGSDLRPPLKLNASPFTGDDSAAVPGFGELHRSKGQITATPAFGQHGAAKPLQKLHPAFIPGEFARIQHQQCCGVRQLRSAGLTFRYAFGDLPQHLKCLQLIAAVRKFYEDQEASQISLCKLGSTSSMALQGVEPAEPSQALPDVLREQLEEEYEDLVPYKGRYLTARPPRRA